MDLEAVKKLLLSNEPSEYRAGVNGFLEFAYKDKCSSAKIWCPCVKCVNRRLKKRDDVYEHLLYDGMLQGYTIWGCHGENAAYIRASQMSESQPKGINSNMHQLVHCAFGYRDNQFPNQQPDDNLNSTKSGPDHETEAFYSLIREADEPLWTGCELSQLSSFVLLFHMKSINKWSNKSMNDLLAILQLAIPNGQNLPGTFVEAWKIIGKLGLNYQKIHACPNNC